MPEETRAQINGLVASKTRGLVKDILSRSRRPERTALRLVVLAQRGAFEALFGRAPEGCGSSFKLL
jgi:hypothetical protein